MLTTTIAIALALCGLLSGCENQAGWQPPVRDYEQFRAEVYPVLLRDCAMSTCHGSPERFLRIWGPGHTRLDPMTSALDRLTTPEAQLTYQLVLSMVDPKHPAKSLLLRKPLAIAAGGTSHGGADKFGRNLYRTPNDQGYLAISRWVFSATAAAPVNAGN